MKEKVIKRTMALLLTVVLCTGLCTGFTVNAGETDTEVKSETEQTDMIQKDDVSSENLPGETEISETIETGTQELKTAENTVQEDREPESPAINVLPEAAEEPEEQEEGQDEQAELSEEREHKLSHRASVAGLSNPRIEKDTSMTAGQKVTWDCVWFGSYPQAEVVSSSKDYTALDKRSLENGDIIADSGLYRALEKASGWDDSNEITIDGNRYRRIKKEDATYASFKSICNYKWSDSTTWHYFKYEPIKWRVLKINGDQALLLSDVVLDDQKYHTVGESVTWETSTIRSWLNGYEASVNKQGIDYSGKNFIGNAFTPEEQSAIVTTSVVNADNIKYGTAGGNNTTDKVFLLSWSEVFGDNAKPHGFVSSSMYTYDEARRCNSSTYAKAMGVSISFYKCHTWCLRSPGEDSDNVLIVFPSGDVDDMGSVVWSDRCGVRAALNLNLSSSQWSFAGTVCSDCMRIEDIDDIKVSRITLSGSSKKIAAGKKIKLTAEVKPFNAKNKAVTWKSGNTKVATVNSKGVVTLKKNSGGKKVTITATAKDGSKKKATYQITSMKGVVKKVAISGKKTRTLKAGKTLKLTAKVTASNSKQANKTLKWSSSNKKYATVSSTGKVKTKKSGKRKTVTITAAATDGSGKKAAVKIKLN